MNMQNKVITVHGVRPTHKHTCVTGEDVTNTVVHEWLCNSPYCEDIQRICPEHGGKEPIVQGYEPWRGR